MSTKRDARKAVACRSIFAKNGGTFALTAVQTPNWLVNSNLRLKCLQLSLRTCLLGWCCNSKQSFFVACLERSNVMSFYHHQALAEDQVSRMTALNRDLLLFKRNHHAIVTSTGPKRDRARHGQLSSFARNNGLCDKTMASKFQTFCRCQLHVVASYQRQC